MLKHTLAKKTILTAALFSSVLLIGCGQKQSKTTEPVQESTSTEDKVDNTAGNTNTVAASAIVDQVMGTMASAMQMANKMTEQQDGTPKFSNEQINCFVTTDNDLAIENVQSYLKDRFSESEIQELNVFFGSEAGKKQSEITKKMLSSMMGSEQIDPSSIENILSEDEQKQISEFWQSPTGAKLQTALNDQEKLEPFIQPFIVAKEQKCTPKSK